MTLREQIIQAHVTNVSDGARPAALKTVERNRTSPVLRTDLGFAGFYFAGERVEYGDTGDSDVPNGAVLRTMLFDVELRWEGAQADGDALIAWVVKQVRKDGGIAGGLAAYTREVDNNWNIEPAEFLLQALTITFECGYFTDAEDMEIPG